LSPVSPLSPPSTQYTTSTQLNRPYICNSPLLTRTTQLLSQQKSPFHPFVQPKKKELSTQKMAPISPIMRMVTQRRALSIFSRARALVRTMEPHPFERLPLAQKTAKADWGKQIKHVGDAAML
jgi:hypothetical protein